MFVKAESQSKQCDCGRLHSANNTFWSCFLDNAAMFFCAARASVGGMTMLMKILIGEDSFDTAN